MSYKIGEDCIGCGTCEDGCIVGAIVKEAEKFAIVKKECTECGRCAENCPVGAIVQE